MSVLDEKMIAHGYVSARALAASTGLPSGTVYKLVRAGKIRSAKVGKLVFVELTSLASYLGADTAKLLGIGTTPPVPPAK